MKTLEYFKQISAIPHCSFNTDKLRDFLADFAIKQNCEVKIDKAGNIHAYKGKPQVCLQAHYDMVCVGNSCNNKIELIEKDGWLSAKDSTLGADNGMGLAIAMELMGEFDNFECLFTNDEEVGLIGANNCEHEIIAPRLLNLDSESDDEVIIGCAASFLADINATPKTFAPQTGAKKYRAHTVGFLGGHSGIDIAKGIKSAISELARFVHSNGGELVNFAGGERTNSISVNACAEFYASTAPSHQDGIICEEISPSADDEVIKNSILESIAGFHQGVYEVDLKAGFVLSSANLAIVKLDAKHFNAQIFARSASNELLNTLERSFKAQFGYADVAILDRDEPWQPIESEFSHAVLAALRKERPHAKAAAIHAGLECGVLKAKQPALQCASIGPNIRAPHSVHERCELASVEMITQVVREILNHY